MSQDWCQCCGFLIKTQGEPVFHKKVDSVTNITSEKNNSSVGKSEEDVTDIQISSPSAQDSEKVWCLDLLIVH